MAKSRVLLRVGVLVGVAVVLTVVASQVRAKRALALATVDDIDGQLAALDPVTRAAVVARLSADAAKTVQDRHTRA